ncbi:MAG: GGDEF domain-containing protein [Eubacteriales bacterium]|nr:GGDEF domain-containing protein [Eubacteriales bacterium]
MSEATRSGKRVVGVLIGDVSADFTSELMAGINEAADRANVQALYLIGLQRYTLRAEGSGARSKAMSHNSVYDYAQLLGVDAFIIACGSLTGFSGLGLEPKFLERFAGKPYVVLQERVAPGNRTYIVVDNYQSFSRCVEHLIVTHGYRKIALVSGPEGHTDARERRNAYLDCMNRHGLPVTPEMIAVGDFSEYVDDLVSRLIDKNPGLEAIAFANDEMAKAGYRECHRRGLVVGQDLAITGFDNFQSGRALEPPLTCVSQDTFRMGQLALERATAMMDGKPVLPIEMRTELVVRQSCGCAHSVFRFPENREALSEEDFLTEVVNAIINGYAGYFTSDKKLHHTEALRLCLQYLREVALNEPDKPLDLDGILARISDYFAECDQPMLLLNRCLEDFIRQFINLPHFSQSLGRFTAAISCLQQYIYSHDTGLQSTRLENYRSQTGIVPEIMRGLFNEEAEEKVFRCVVQRLLHTGIENVYLCRLENPRRCDEAEPVQQRLRLAAYASHGRIVAYSGADMPGVNGEHPFLEMPEFREQHAMMAISLFSGERQYGILWCDADSSKSGLLHMIGMQLGMLMDFLNLRDKERMISEELEDIREKNEILNFLSEYDSLCKLLNRRGFIEKAIRRNRESIGQKACCVFMDLDYLKQINDTFGHSEGDIALQGVSDILKRITTSDDLLGRIGGDEFVGMFLTDDPAFEEHFLDKLHREFERYNAQVKKPYRLEISVGMAFFICRQGLEVSGVLAEADNRLYEAKHHRKHTKLQRR